MLELLQRIVSSDAFVQVVVALVAAVWALPRISAWRQSVAEGRWSKLLDLAEVAVAQTWNEYTDGLKQAREDGQLTNAEAASCREYAARALRQIAANRLPGVIDSYGQEALEALVGLVYGRLQAEGGVG